MEPAHEPLDIQAVLQAAREAERMLHDIQSFSEPTSASQDAEMSLPVLVDPAETVNWSPSKEYYASPKTPSALSPSKRSRSLLQSRQANTSVSSRRFESLSGHEGSPVPSTARRGGTSDLFASRNTARRAATAPLLSSTMPGRFSQTHHTYGLAAKNHRELRRGTQTLQEAFMDRRRGANTLDDVVHTTATSLDSMQVSLQTTIEKERALDRQIAELTGRLGDDSFRLKAEANIQERLHAPCKKIDAEEVAGLVAKLSALKEAIKECEAWRTTEKYDHKKAVQDNIDRLMQKKQKVQELRKLQKEEQQKLLELKSKQVKEEICGTNFFLSEDPEEDDGEGEVGIQALVQSSVLNDQNKHAKAGSARKETNYQVLFDQGGPNELLNQTEQLPSIRRLMALQGVSNKFTRLGREVAKVQRALEATETTSSSNIKTALDGILELIRENLNCNIVSIYKVDEVNRVMSGMAPEHVTDYNVPLGQGLVGFAALSNSILRTSNARKHPAFSPEHEDYVPEVACSCICMPVHNPTQTEGKLKVYGVVKVMGRVSTDGSHQEFKADDIAMLRWAANEVYQITFNCQQFSDAVKEVGTISAHMRTTMELSLQFDQKGILVMAAKRIASILVAEIVVVYCLDRGSGELVGYTSEKKPQIVRRPLQGLLGAVFEKGGLEDFVDVRKRQRFVSHVDQPPGVKVESMALITMHSARLATIGIIQVCNKLKPKGRGSMFGAASFSDRDMAFLGRIAKDVSVAVGNSQALRVIQERRLGLQNLKVVNVLLDTLRQITYDLRDVLACENAKVVLVDEDAQQLMVPDFSSRRYYHYPVGEGIASTVMSTKAPVEVSEHKEWKGPQERVDSVGVAVSTMICAPTFDIDTGKVIAVLMAVNKRRTGMFDEADKKSMETCCQKAAFLLHNAELYECQAQDQETQSSLADKFGALLLSRTDKFRFIQNVEELCFEMMQPVTSCHLLLAQTSGEQETFYFPNNAGSLSIARKLSLDFGTKAIRQKEVASGMEGDLRSSDEHTGESILPVHVVAHPLIYSSTSIAFGALCFQREAISAFRPTEEKVFSIMAARVSVMYIQMLENVELATQAQSRKLAQEQQRRQSLALNTKLDVLNEEEEEDEEEEGSEGGRPALQLPHMN